VGAVSKNLK